MLEDFQEVPGFISKPVFVNDDRKVSISEYYKGSKIERSDVYTLFHIIRIALSCEYSEITYKYIILGDNTINRCVPGIKAEKGCLYFHLSSFTHNHDSIYLKKRFATH